MVELPETIGELHQKLRAWEVVTTPDGRTRPAAAKHHGHGTNAG